MTTQSAKAGHGCSIAQLGPETASCQWLTTKDGVTHFTRFWSSTTSGPVVIYLHGIEGHSRWFEETALALAERGISTYALDRRGAGASNEQRGHIADHSLFVRDVEEISEIIRSRHSSSPLFLVANCWGGKVALAAAAKTTDRFAGLILTSPAVSVQVDVSLATKLMIGIDYLFGGGNYFDIPLSPEHFTDEPIYLQYIATDPQRLTRATSSFFVENLKLTRLSQSATKTLGLPILVLQSGRDRIVALTGLQKWFDTIRSSDKTLKIFTSAAHSLDFDKEASQYQSSMADWILARAKST